MPYPVLDAITHDGKDYQPGDRLSMPDAIALPLVEQGVLGPEVCEAPAELPPEPPADIETPVEETPTPPVRERKK